MPARKKETQAQKNRITGAKKDISPKKPVKRKSSSKASAPAKAEKPAELLKKEINHFPIVGIGSSAGGLEALELFF